MPRINFDAADKYSNSNGKYYLKLTNDGDYEEVTLLADTVDDIPIYAVHKVEVNGFVVKVNCLRAPDEDKHVCPLCAAGKPSDVSVELLLYTADGEVKVFERGKKFIPKIQHWAKRYPLLCKPVFEVVRIGKAGDMQTTYEFEAVGNGKITSWKELVDEEQIQSVLDAVIRNWSVEDMRAYLSTGNDPKSDNSVVRKNKNSEFRARGVNNFDRRPAMRADNDETEAIQRRRSRQEVVDDEGSF